MTRSGRALTLAATLNVILACTAHAQTVIVRSAPPGSTIDLTVNTEAAGTTTADAAGDARLTLNMFTAPGKTETDAYLYVDFCKDNRRVLIVERSGQPAPVEAGCDRRQESSASSSFAESPRSSSTPPARIQPSCSGRVP